MVLDIGSFRYLVGPMQSWAETFHLEIQKETNGFQTVFLHVDPDQLATGDEFPLKTYVGYESKIDIVPMLPFLMALKSVY
jgi:hypothetical protein